MRLSNSAQPHNGILRRETFINKPVSPNPIISNGSSNSIECYLDGINQDAADTRTTSKFPNVGTDFDEDDLNENQNEIEQINLDKLQRQYSIT